MRGAEPVLWSPIAHRYDTLLFIIGKIQGVSSPSGDCICWRHGSNFELAKRKCCCRLASGSSSLISLPAKLFFSLFYAESENQSGLWAVSFSLLFTQAGHKSFWAFYQNMYLGGNLSNSLYPKMLYETFGKSRLDKYLTYVARREWRLNSHY